MDLLAPPTGSDGSGADQTAERRLRDLSDDEFARRYDCDRFTATVVANKLRYTAAHMARLYMSQAFSPFIRDGGDMAGILSGPAALGYPMISFSETNPLFYGSIPDAVPVALEEFGPDRLAPGDVILVNDYYRVGTHLNDVCTIRPFFYEGELLGAITIKAHLADIGGSVMGGFELTKRTVYEDGLRLSPILLYSGEEPVEATFRLIHDNSRAGDVIVPDLRSQCAALAHADRLMTELIDRYGVAAYAGTVRYVCDESAEAMGDALRRLPDGIYEGEDFLDGDGLADSPEYCVRVRITKVGDRAEFDLRGSSGPSRTSVNCTWADVKTGVSMALKFLLDPHASVTGGTMRNIDVVVPERSIVNAAPPTGCQYYWEVVMAIHHAIYDALNPVLGPDAVTAGTAPIVVHSYGHRPDGREWNSTGYLLTECGPWGATRHGDGDSGQQPVIGNLMVVGGVELFELRAKVVMLASEYVPDTAGPGRHRGGAGNAHDAWWRVPAEHRLSLFHARRPSAGGGVFGGRAGPTSAGWMFAAETVAALDPPFVPMTLSNPVYAEAVPLGGVLDPLTHEVDPRGVYVFQPGRTSSDTDSVVRTFFGGGGGWGDPLDRDPDDVLRDVRDEYVSIEGAARDYGVVVRGDLRHPEQLSLDPGATAGLRSQLRTRRDEGGDGGTLPA
jgi:N-methylhydantoinase B